MANFFNYFPKTPYFLDEEKIGFDVVTNLSKKIKFDDNIKENALTYYEYLVEDGDTPEIISDKIYGSTERHWIILLLNDMIHPQFDWPLDSRSLYSYIDKKYLKNADTANNETGLQWASTNIKDYVVKESKKSLLDNSSVENIFMVDSGVYANTLETTVTQTTSDGYNFEIKTEKTTKSYYEYEIEKNESKRSIKLLKPEFVPTVEEEFRKTFAK